MKHFFYICMLSITICSYASANTINNSTTLQHTVTDQQLHDIIVSLYSNAQESNTVELLPTSLVSTAQRINHGETLDRSLCVDALHCYIDGLSQSLINNSRAIRQNAPMGTNPAVPVVPQFCDLTQVLALLGAIRASIGSISDSACDQTIFGILGDACTILSGQNICEALLQIERCCASISATVQGVNTFTVLADLKATMSTDFLQTWTILTAIENEISAGLCGATFIHNTDVGTGGYVINTAGTYKLAEDILFTPTAAVNAITINASNVILDLQCFFIKQTNSTSNVNAIECQNFQQNVIIQNGQINNFTQDGILLNGTDIFIIQNVIIENCAIAAIDIEQAAGVSATAGLIDKCTISACCSSASASAAIVLNRLLGSKVSNCVISYAGLNNPSFASFLSSIQGSSLTDVVFENIVSTGGQAPGFRAFNLSNSTNCQFNNCSSIGDLMFGSAGGPMTSDGFQLGSCIGIYFNNCTVQGFSSSGTFSSLGTIVGFEIIGSQSIFLNNCQVLNCSNSAPAIPVFIGIELNSSSNSVCNNCSAVANSSAGTSTGIQITSSNSNTIRNCLATLNSSSTTLCQGLLVEGNNNIVDGCQFSRNTGNGDANSFGIQISSGSNNIFTQCRGLFNGNTAANQLSGIAAGSVANLNSGNTATATGPWGNVGVIP